MTVPTADFLRRCGDISDAARHEYVLLTAGNSTRAAPRSALFYSAGKPRIE